MYIINRVRGNTHTRYSKNNNIFSTTKMTMVMMMVLVLSSTSIDRVYSAPSTSSSNNNNKSGQDEIAISVVSLLLPYTQSKSQVLYRLEAKNGCFDWSTNNPELLSLEVVYDTASTSCDNSDSTLSNPLGNVDELGMPTTSNKCSTAVLVGVRGSFSDRLSTLIIAEEKSTGMKLRCEVFVDRIDAIAIKSTTRTMYKDSVEVLEVQAVDKQGNIFSTIVGVEFEWTVSSGNILQIVPFKEHKMTNDPVLLSMEQRGLQSSEVLVQGIDTGRADITVRLTEPRYQEVKPTTVIISVLEPLSLNPSQLLYVIPGTQIQYVLQSEKRNQIEKINMPNPQYVWTTSNKQVGVVDNSGLFMATNFGKTDLTVQHKNMSENRAHTIIHVVNPSYLALKVEGINLQGPVNNWNLIENKDYTLIVELYDASGHKIYNSDISYEVDISKDYFQPIQPPSNKGSDTYFVKAIKDGITNVKASLLKIYDPKIGKFTSLLHPISVEQELTISPQIKVHPSNLYVPFVGRNTQQYGLKATGGSGDYNWFTSNRTLVDIDASGTVTTTFKKGQADITVIDKKNPHNREKAKVHVVDPTSIEFVPSALEVEIDQALPLSTIIKSSHLPKGQQFDSCLIPDLSWKVEDSKVFQIDHQAVITQQQPNHCSTKKFVALKEGNSLIQVDYNDMTTQTRIFAYPPLRMDRDQVLVTLGASIDIHHYGGPEQWYMEPKSYFQSVEAERPSMVEVVMTSQSSFRVTCLQHSDQYITLRVGNKPSPTNPHPALPSLRLHYRCQAPKSVQLSINEQEVDANNVVPSDQDKERMLELGVACSTAIPSIGEQRKQPGELTSYKIRNNREIPFVTRVFDETGKLFTNHSTLVFGYESADAKLARWMDNTHHKGHSNRLSLLDEIGKVVVSAVVTGYNADQLKHAKVTVGKEQLSLDANKMKSQLELDLLSTVQLRPAHSTLYLSSKNQLVLEAIGGSKHFIFTSNNSKIAQLDSKIGSPLVKVTPSMPGYLQVDVRDICLGGDGKSLPAVVFISDVGTIDMRVDELIAVGKSMPVQLEALASNGQPFDESQYQYINFIPHIDNPSVIEVVVNPQDPRRYTLRAIDSGVATLSFASHNPQTGATITSKSAQINVFPPFTISPQHLHLVPGSHFQIQPQGGVARQTVQFSSTNPTVASIGRDISGELIAHAIGEATIMATAHYIDRDSGKKTFIGEDKLTVTVKNMTGINLHSTINRVLVGNELKLRVIGENGETPFTYGTVDLLFGWECLDNKTVELVPVYAKANTTVDMEASFSVRVLGKQPGTTQILVFAYHASDRTKRIFQSPPFQVDVIANAAFPTYSLLLTPNSHYEMTDIKSLDYNTLDHAKAPSTSSSSICSNSLHIADNKVTTSDRTGSCYLEVTRDGRQDTTSLIKVSTKLIAHLELVPLDARTMVLPIGATISFGLYLRDDLGDLFTDYGTGAKAFERELSTSGVIGVSIESNSRPGEPPVIVRVKANNVGVVTLRVLLRASKAVDDYVKIFVGRLIEPDSAIVHVGSTIQVSLATNLLSMRGYSVPAPGDRIWATSDASILAIDAVTGKSHAAQSASGRATITYTRNPSSQTSVRVSRVATIETDLSTVVVGSNNGGKSSEQYTYPLRFLADDGSEFTQDTAVEHNFDCSCAILESQFASATCVRGTTPSTYHNYACVVRTRNDGASSAPSSDKLTLTVGVSNAEKSYLVEQTFAVQFENAFRIMYRSDSQLSPANPSLRLKVQSSGHLFVESSDASLLSVTQVASSAANVYEYLVTPVRTSAPFSNVAVHISSTGGKTRQSIPVSYSPTATETRRPSTYTESDEDSFIPYATVGRVLIALLIAVLTFIGSTYYNRKPQTTIEVKTPPRSGLGSAPPPSPFRSPLPSTHSPINNNNNNNPPQYFSSPSAFGNSSMSSSFNNSINNNNRSQYDPQSSIYNFSQSRFN